MKTPQLWKHLKRHPLSAEYRDITGPAFFRFAQGFKVIRFLPRFPIILLDGQVLDGWQRLRACIETNVEPTFEKLPEGIDPAAYVECVNDERRHETSEERQERIGRVAERRKAGESLRAIAEAEGISEAQTRRDLEEANSGAPGEGAPETETKEEPPKVTGRDGKKYDAKKPAPPPPPADEGPPANDEKKPKAGKPSRKFDEKKFEAAYGSLVRVIDERGNAMGKGPHHRNCQDLLGQFLKEYSLWKKETS